MGSSVVVVIVGAIIAAIAFVTVRDGPKPATPARDPKRQAAPRHAKRPKAARPAAPIARNDPVRTRSDQGTEPEATEDLRRTPGQRLRALGLLVVTVVTLGSITAAVLGAVVLVGARVLDRALG